MASTAPTRKALPSRLIAAFFGLAVAAAGGYYVVAARPWHKDPDPLEVETAWKAVEESAVFEPEATGDVALWSALAKESRGASGAVDAATKRNASDWADLEPEIVKATDALTAWSEGHGALAPERCETPESLLPVFKMVRLGLQASRSPASRFVVAASRLARLLRHASTALPFVVGLSVTDEIRKWAVREKVAPDPALRALRPLPAEKHTMLAREAVCHDRYYDTFAAAGTSDGMFATVTSKGPGAPTGPNAPPWHARRFVDAGRERKMVRLFRGNELARCAPKRDDAPAYDACTAVDVDHLPKSLGVLIAVVQSPPTAKYVEAYDAFLAGR